MRAGLLVNSCTSCLATATSVQGSTSKDACTCLSGAYKSVSASKQRAITLVPGRAQLSTLVNHNQSTYASTAIFDSTAGPLAGNGTVTFDRGLSQYINGGQHTFNIATNVGFTAVVVVKFTGVGMNAERIFDSGDSQNINNILMWRISTQSNLFYLGMQNGNQRCQLVLTALVFTNVWTTIVVKYTSKTQVMELRTGGTTNAILCTFAIADRTVANMFVGKSNWPSDAYSNVAIDGLYAVDVALSDSEVVQIIDDMYMGNDVLQSCQECSTSTVSQQGSTEINHCECIAGSFKSILPPDVNHRALVLVPLRTELLDSTRRNTDLVNLKTGMDRWRLVRFLPLTSKTWYSQNDDLAGIAPRGMAYDYNTEWSIPFGEFDEFCFSTLNFLHWLRCTKDAAIGQKYSNTPRPVKHSSILNTSYNTSWYNRASNPEDPWIGLRNHNQAPTDTDTGDRTLYGENTWPSWNTSSISLDGGMCVWVRSSANKPTVNHIGGPSQHCALSFNRSLSQQLDCGLRTLNIANNGGFTFVALVMFATGDDSVASMYLLDFKGTNNGRVIFSRTSTNSTKLSFFLRDSSGLICNLWSFDDIIENEWLTLVGMYTTHDQRMAFKIGNKTMRSFISNHSLSNFDVTQTSIGASTYALNPNFHGNIAGLYVVDAVLHDLQITEISDRMYRSDNILEACASCPFNTFKTGVGKMLSSCTACPPDSASAPAAVVVTNCTCNAGVIGDDGGPCTSCVAGTYKENTGSIPSTCDLYLITSYSTILGATNLSTCQSCPLNSDAPEGRNVRSNCTCNARFTGADGDTCIQCAAGTFKFTSGLAACIMVACPAGQFASAQASNVARMCGSAQNAPCPAVLSTLLAGSSADFGNDGLFTHVAQSSVQTGPHTFMIDFQQTRSIQIVKFFNRVDAQVLHSNGAQIRVGSSTAWASSTICATLITQSIQTHECNLSG